MGRLATLDPKMYLKQPWRDGLWNCAHSSGSFFLPHGEEGHLGSLGQVAKAKSVIEEIQQNNEQDREMLLPILLAPKIYQ